MMHHELPVYRSAYAFLLSMFQLCRGFDREYKFTLGENIKKDGLELLQLIYLACVRADHSALLPQARERLELIRLQMRLLMDLKQISLKQFAHLAEQLESVSRQLNGWQKAMEKKSGKISPDQKKPHINAARVSAALGTRKRAIQSGNPLLL
jgi:hypothetical protein